jgi:hypothetical protein
MPAVTHRGTRIAACALLLGLAGCPQEDQSSEGAPAEGEPADGSGPEPLDAMACKELEGAPLWASAWAVVEGERINSGTREGAFSGELEASEPLPQGVAGVGHQGGSSHPFRVRVHQSLSYELALSLPLGSPVVEIGDVVSVRFAIETETWGPTTGFVEIRDPNGELIAWLEQSASGTNSLSPPDEIAVEEAGAPCSYDNICGETVRRGLRVAMGDSEAELSFGAIDDMGDYFAIHGENSSFVLNGTTNCYDVFSSHDVVVAVVRKP